MNYPFKRKSAFHFERLAQEEKDSHQTIHASSLENRDYETYNVFFYFPVRITLWRLRAFNAGVGLLHLIQFAALFGIGLWKQVPLNLVNHIQLSGPTEPLNIDTQFLPFLPLIVSAMFSLMSAVGHFMLAANYKNCYGKIMDEKYNYIRWMEYSISSSIMLLNINVISGVTDLFANICSLGCNVGMILFGDVSDRFRIIEGKRKEAFVAFFYGTIIGLFPWVCIFASYGQVSVHQGTVPWFVHAIILSIFFQFSSFGVNQLFVLLGKVPFMKGEYTFAHGEINFALLSITCKSSLAWQLFGAFISRLL